MHAACLRLSIAIRSRLSKSSCCCLTSIAETTGASAAVCARYVHTQKDVAVATISTEKKRSVPRRHAGLQAVSLSDRHALLPVTRW
jgi:hypothetical protein